MLWPQALETAVCLQLWLPWLAQEQLSNAQPASQLGEFMMSVRGILFFLFPTPKTL